MPAGEIGVVIAQVGQPRPIGAKSAVYKKEFGNFTNLRTCWSPGAVAGTPSTASPRRSSNSSRERLRTRRTKA